MIQDLRQAARSLRRSPGFATSAVLTLALGIGASTAVFSVLDVVFLRPLPLAHADRLVRLRDFVRAADGRRQESNTSAASFEAIRAGNQAFEAIAAFRYGSATVPSAEAPERLGVVGTTAPLGSALGVRPVIGRDFGSEEVRAGGDSRVVLISHALWQRRFSAAPLETAALPLDGIPHAVIGVMQPGFHFPYDADAWVPARLEPLDEPAVFARLKPGIGLARANADLAAIADRVRAEHPEVGGGFGILATPARRSLIGDEDRVTVGLLVLVGLLLLLTGADVASLLLARSVSRRTEQAVRAALGASRARLAGPAAAEAFLLAATAAGAGLLISLSLQSPLATLVPDNLRHQLGLSRPTMGWHTLAFCFLTAALAAVVCAAAPAWRGRREGPGAALRDAGRSQTLARGESRALAFLVSVEVALALALLCGAGSFGLHLRREERRRLGLQTANVLTMQLALPRRLSPGAGRASLTEAILRDVRAVPGVAAAGLTTVNPLAGGTWVTPIEVEGAPPPDPSLRFLANYRLITPQLLAAMGASLLDGRDFDSRDAAASTPVALVSQSLTQRFWPDSRAVGKRLRLAGSEGEPWRTVVGIVGDVADAGEVADAWYLPYEQRADADAADELFVMVRSRAGVSPGALSTPVRRAIAREDRNLGAYAVTTMEEVRREVLARQRVGSLLIGVLAAFGTLVALLGTYGVAAYRMERRRREIGLRLALGAAPARALRECLREGLSPVAAGLAGGAALVLIEAALLRRLVPGIQGVPAGLAAGLGAALAAAAAGGLLAPAHRLSRLDPAAVLQERE